MPITKQEVIKRLGADEPKYAALAKMGPEAVPHLRALIKGEDMGLAAKATYLASVIQTEEAIEALSDAAMSPHAIIRVAAAAGLGNLSDRRAIPWPSGCSRTRTRAFASSRCEPRAGSVSARSNRSSG